MADQAGEYGQLMFRFTRFQRSTRSTVGRVLFNCLILLLLSGSGGSNASTTTAKEVAQYGGKPDPDALLIDVYKDLAANHLRDALQKADRLVEAYPNFHLAHLIRGDLLLMHAHPVTALGAAANAPADKLKDFRDEAMVRLRSLRQRPDPDLVPNSILMLREDQNYVLVADAKQSRLYVYQHHDGQLKFITDYYITQGKLGVNKVKEGDQKTPIGVYYITRRLPKAKLPDFYGAGALPINYPNEWDKLNGRSGSGIWLHGTPSDSYSRPPLASDGCVVLTNPDLEKLSLSVEIGKTPIVISDQVEFISRSKWDAERNASVQMMDLWRRDLESLDSERVLNNYSKKFKSNLGENLNSWFPKYRLFLQGKTRPTIKLRDMTLFRYPGRDEMVVSTFTQETVIGRGKATIRKRQYWAKEGTQWKIIYEGTL